MSSTSYRLNSTSGQASALGTISSAGYVIDSGFWHTMLHLVVGDINGDGHVDLEDVISVLQVVTGQSITTVAKQADMNGNGKIEMVEALMLLKKLSDL